MVTSTTVISVVSPVYQAEEVIDQLVNSLIEELSLISPYFEIILVEDGSSDRSWVKISEHCKKYPQIKGIKLSRNFGQHHAVTAGLEKAAGDYIIIMDCDLQDNPKLLRTLYSKALEGHDIVFTKRRRRQHTILKALTAKFYNALFYLFADTNYNIDAGSLTLMTKKVRLEFIKIPDRDRLYIQLLKWLGFNSASIEIDHEPRFAGKSSYTLYKLLAIAISGWTSYSDKLLRFSTYMGLLFSVSAFLAALYIVVRYFTHGFQSGWASLMVLILFSTGVILISIGIAGIYLGKVFEQSKNRPLYVVDQKLNI